MEKAKTIQHILESETFSRGDRHYFIDLKKTVKNDNYLRITRADKTGENQYTRTQVILFEEEFFFFLEALSMVMGRLNQSVS